MDVASSTTPLPPARAALEVWAQGASLRPRLAITASSASTDRPGPMAGLVNRVGMENAARTAIRDRTALTPSLAEGKEARAGEAAMPGAVPSMWRGEM